MNGFFVRVLALVLAVIAAPTCASAAVNAYRSPNYAFPDGSPGFAFNTTGGAASTMGVIVNPGVIVGFNPQPDPPGAPLTLLNLRDPTAPSFVASGGGTYLVTVSLLAGRGSSLLPAVQAPDPNTGNTTATFCDGSVMPSTGACDGSVFVMTLGFSGPGASFTWGAFNPQPDPPGDWFSYEIGFLTANGAPAAGIASFSLSITENGAPLTFSPVPEPATWALMGLGFAAIGSLTAFIRRQAAAKKFD